ncbi:MAG: TIGR01548 family HAD-type hydrolase [Polyangiaceae bacterium]
MTSAITSPTPLRPSPAIAALAAYSVGRHPAPIDLALDGNEGAAPDASLLDALTGASPELLRRYPKTDTLTGLLAARLSIDPSRLLVTSGADDALDRVCRAFLAPGREIVLPVPTFEMIARYATIAGGTLREVPWPEGAYPTEAVIEALDAERTAVVAMVTPNNPTGAVASAEDLRRLAREVATRAPGAIVLLDLAYAEFADEDLMAVGLELDNVVMTRTLSKAWGLAGLRVGYAVAPPEVIDWLRRAGHPYAVSAPSLRLAEACLREGRSIAPFVAQVREERGAIAERLAELGISTPATQANYVFARTPRRAWLRDGLAGLGIGVRAWPGHRQLDDALRITCPGDDAGLSRLLAGLSAVLAPEALLFDMDGVIADVRGSYRRAIVETAAHFGVEVTVADIAAQKAAGDANNDWVLTQRLLTAAGKDVAFDAVKARFEELYQGGLYREETLMCRRELLQSLRRERPLAIVTGRPRHDAERFLGQHDLRELFDAVICLEDGPLKPSPAPVKAALERLGVSRAWMLGDTPDDIVAARAAGVVPLGVSAMDADPEVLYAAGAARVMADLDDLLEILS